MGSKSWMAFLGFGMGRRFKVHPEMNGNNEKVDKAEQTKIYVASSMYG